MPKRYSENSDADSTLRTDGEIYLPNPALKKAISYPRSSKFLRSITAALALDI
jgi:hypothetical protein